MVEESGFCSTKSNCLISSLGGIAEGWRLLWSRVLVVLLFVLMCSGGTFAYSVLTHEEIVDLLWKDEICPLFLVLKEKESVS